ncbi:hypothetical protein R84B8_01937 [Treponema sp. R8-4-B8]
MSLTLDETGDREGRIFNHGVHGGSPKIFDNTLIPPLCSLSLRDLSVSSCEKNLYFAFDTNLLSLIKNLNSNSFPTDKPIRVALAIS